MPSQRPLILLPPSEGKASGGDGPAWAPGTMAIDLDGAREQVLRALGTAMRGSLAARSKLLGVKGDALAAATEENRTVRTSATMPAVERYTGVLYDELDVGSLPTSARNRLGSSVLIVSGLWGLVAPTDPIPAYKLKMGASVGRLGRLSSWWREPLSAALLERTRGRTVWNLLPKEHDAAWSAPEDLAQTSVEFLEPGRGGELVAVAHWNKLLKGALVRHLLEHPGTSPDGLRDWEHPLGFRMDPARTRAVGGRTVVSLVRSRS